MGVGRTILWPLRGDSPITSSGSVRAQTYSHSHRARHNIIQKLSGAISPELRSSEGGSPAAFKFTTQYLYCMAHQFIDFGDSVSATGPQSSIGSYDDLDSFIDNASVSSERALLDLRNSPQQRGNSRQSTPLSGVLLGERRSPGLFVTPGPPSRRSGSSTPLIRRLREVERSAPYRVANHGVRMRQHGVGRVPSSQQPSQSPTSSWVRGQRQREFSTVNSVSSGEQANTLPGSIRESIEPLDAEPVGEDPESAFQIPGHLRGAELNGVGVPSKRLGTNRPRWVARFFLFTFSQSGYDWPYQRFVDLIETLGGKYHISRELHEDGGYHFHCLVDFERKFEFENEHRFCVGPPRTDPRRKCPVETHCNILPVPRTPFNAWDYVTKYGDIVASNLERPRARGPNVTRDDMWTGSISQANKEAFLDDIKKHSARDYVLFNKQITSFASRTYDPIKADLPRIEEDGIFVHWERYPEARQWVLESISEPIARIKSLSRGLSYPVETQQRDEAWITNRPNARRRRPKSLIVWGGTRLGKTLFATSLGPHIHWQRDFNLKRILAVGVENIEYVIFDDIGWKNSALAGEGYKAWLGGQAQFDVTDKYCGKNTIKWGKPTIVLSNKDPYIGLEPDEIDWFEGNCIVIHIGAYDEMRSNAICSSDADAET